MPLSCESNFKNCHKPDPNSYAFHLLETLRVWLSSVTGIPWYQSHEDAKQPDQIFGIAEITGAIRGEKAKSDKKIINEDDACKVMRRYYELSIALKVKNKSKAIYNGQEYIVTPLDILMDVQMSYDYQKIANSLNSFTIKEFNEINSLVKEDDSCCWHNEASMNIELCVVREFSRTEKIIKDICLSICKDGVSCPKQESECD